MGIDPDHGLARRTLLSLGMPTSPVPTRQMPFSSEPIAVTENAMSPTVDKADPFDPYGIVASIEEWCCLQKAAQEVRKIDEEMLETMLEAEAPRPATNGLQANAKLRSITDLMRSLRLDPEAIRRKKPAALRALEEACLDCTERSRCAYELRAGTATGTYREFCSNALRLDRVQHA